MSLNSLRRKSRVNKLPPKSARRSGKQGALPVRAGVGDYLNIRLAGTPEGRFACEPEQGFFWKRRLCALSRIAVALKKPLRRMALGCCTFC